VAEVKEALQAQIAKQVESEQRWKGERDKTAAEVARLKATADDLTRLRSDAEGHSIELSQSFSDLEMRHSESISERDRAFAEVAELKATVEGLRQARPGAGPSEPTKRWLSPIAAGLVLLAAVVAGALVSLSPGRKADGEAGAKFAELTAAVTKSDKARQDAEAKVTELTVALTKSDKARQDAETKADQATAALGKSEKARQDAEARAADAEKARQAAASRADDADKARQAALARADDADRSRRAAEAKIAQARQPEVASTSDTAGFSLKYNMQAEFSNVSSQIEQQYRSASTLECEKICANSYNCGMFSYYKPTGACWLYTSVAPLRPNPDVDSGVRIK
jgi:hypothetical protein